MGITHAGPRDADWAKVEEARKQQQPKTAIELLGGIEEAAFADGAWAEGTRALSARIAQEAVIEGLASPVKKLEAAIDTAPEQARPALRALSARWLSAYFYQNRWRFMQRSTTAGPVGEDIESWDLAKILGEVDSRFQRSLAEAEALKKVSAADFAEILTNGALGDGVRPTMYDFLAHAALEFYSAEEVAVSRPVGDFEIPAASAVFGTPEEFLAWNPQIADASTPKARALKILKDLLSFHQADADKTAFLAADLERLRWAAGAAAVEGRDARREQALQRFIEVNASHPLSAWARVDLAELLQANKKTKEAHAILKVGAEAFPESPFGKLCTNGIKLLEQRGLSLATESHWTPAGEEIRVDHRNLKRVWFRLYSADFKADKESLEQDPGLNPPPGEPVRAWDSALPDDGDFTERTTRFPAPADLAPGYYVLRASAREDFAEGDNVLASAGIHVTPLAVLVRSMEGQGLEGNVVDAVTGAPQDGVEIEVLTIDPENQNNRDPQLKRFGAKSDKDGYFKIGNRVTQRYIVIASRGKERAVSRSWAQGYFGGNERVTSPVVLFTDRAIYRPGQTVHFKGIWCEINPAGGKYRVLPNRAASIVVRDPNGKEVAKIAVKTNERGSFSGTFTAPEGSVLGRCSISVPEAPHGYGASILVEEYKRPKFFTEVDAPSDPAALGKPVRVKVRAEAYTGAPIDGGKLAWRVTRTARLPLWMRWCWWAPPISSEAEEIAHGTAETDASGAVIIEFMAKADLSIQENVEPVFDFTVVADVTDGNGETRSATRMVSVAYTTLKADLTSPEWLEAGKELEFGVRTASHDGEGRPATGVLKIHRLKEPASCPRPENNVDQYRGVLLGGDDSESGINPDKWEPGELVAELPVETDKEGKGSVKRALDAGIYRLIYETKDANGKKVAAMLGIQVIATEAADFPTMVPFYTGMPAAAVEPGGEAVLVWGSGHETARACIEWRVAGKLLKREFSAAGRTQQAFHFPIVESYRGGISVRVWQVTRNRLHAYQGVVDVPWSNKTLKLRWEHLVSKLEPGAKETWTAVIEGAGGEAAVAEMMGTLYDASLDAFAPHAFRDFSSFFRREWDYVSAWHFGSSAQMLQAHTGFTHPDLFSPGELFRRFKPEVELAHWGPRTRFGRGFGGGRTMARTQLGMDAFADAAPMEGAPAAAPAPILAEQAGGVSAAKAAEPGQAAAPPNVDLGQVTARANLQETAFFFPDLVSGEDGKVRMSFTMPEALTKWRFLGLAHDKDLRSGLLEGETVTAKDLMVQPNPPRFLREGDELWFSVKISNQSDKVQEGVARLTLADAATEADKSAAMGIAAPEQAFSVPAKESRTLKWRVVVPDGAGFLRYKAVASAGSISDGEEGWLPIIPRRILVTESLALPVRDAGKKEFEFTKLLQSGGSDSLENRFLHVQVVSQPAWYAVMSLPYLMEFPHECAEQTFNRYYANALARSIATSDPKIRRVFEQWKAGGKALDSPLLKNQDLKGILLDETPWLAEAKSESEARRKVGLLFDDNQLGRELEKALAKLAAMQHGDGLWPWFPGGRGDEYISLYISTGFARLRALGVETDVTPALKALEAIDAGITDRYQELLKNKQLDNNNLDSRIALYLYTRSFFLKDKALKAEDKVAFDYFAGQARKHWTGLGSRMSKAHAALALHRLGDKEVPKLVTRSLKEHAKIEGELGMYWKDSQGEGWWWWQAPIETQAMMIEAFRDIDQDEKAVEDCQVWLIKQKQVQDWKTTKATADAVYSLLRGGRNLLGSDALLKISLGGAEVKPESVEAGTGFYESRFTESAVKPELGKIEVEKTDKGVSWASVHWQYLEDMAKITPHDGTPLHLEKSLFVRKNSDKGSVLVPLEGAVKVGDELVTRVVLKNDRAMEYVHLKDLRGSGTEPVNVLSGYRWQDGFGYYEVTRDTASHFFIDRLPPGTHVFETSVRVQHAGKYQTGIAEIRCMYAPEFNAHSASLPITVE
ncbi:MG2 domain-containing protein [Luteolibacter sp. GHJ8]|uniref:MG2 domain-containing protein n=1 Tax=Luteolibacter rhizosphaerae TaxID=2989719 RepID=A0ABT3G9F9_9BACT|nr:alpha-2-macroglobulin family protein [Luteolibacter rhizosphaerae]MCW1916440.1 MG2 domain-containing protein [Luteolibacter rhizosphaerae]